MAYTAPRGILVAGGATSQLLGVALQLHYLEQGISLEIVYVHTKMSHTEGFIFQGVFKAEEISVTSRIEKYLPSLLLRYQSSISQVFDYIRPWVSNIRRKKNDSVDRILTVHVDNRIEKVATWNSVTGLIDGGIWPGIIGITVHSLQEFFSNSSLPNPFILTGKTEFNISIHYRLGDMRTDPHWRKTHGVLDPMIILQEVEKILGKEQAEIPIYVYSDEPAIAKLLLESVGMTDCVYIQPSDIWSDLRRMSNSAYFIGSFSTVSMVAAEIRTSQKLSSNQLPLNCRKHKISQKLSNTKYFEARLLPLRHWVYKISIERDFN
jgi:hypothetical protein